MAVRGEVANLQIVHIVPGLYSHISVYSSLCSLWKLHVFHHPHVSEQPVLLTSSRSLLCCLYKSVKTAAIHFQIKQQHAVATVTYTKVSRWHPRNTDAFHLTRLNGSLHKVNSESLLLQEWQAIKTELHILWETHNTPSLQPVLLLQTQWLCCIAQMLCVGRLLAKLLLPFETASIRVVHCVKVSQNTILK